MKKLFVLILAFCMTMSLNACGEADASSNSQSQTSSGENDAVSYSAIENDTESTIDETIQTEAEAEETEGSSDSAEESKKEAEEFSVVVDRDNEKGQLLDAAASVEEIISNISPKMPANLPLTEEDESISFMSEFNETMYTTLPNGYADCYGFQIAEALTGVEIEFILIGSGVWTEQFNLIVASGNYPDLVAAKTEYTGGNDLGIENGFILPLNDYLETYCPNYWGLLNNDGNMIQAVTDSGYISGFFHISSGVESVNGTGNGFVRTDWLETVGMEKPTTYDELYAVLKAFQTELGAEEPIMWPAALVSEDEGLASGYGVAGNAMIDQRGTNIPYYVTDGEVHYGIVEDGFYEFMQMCRKWYDEGLISSEFLTKNENSRDADFINTITQGNTGVFFIDDQEVESIIEMAQENDAAFAVEAMTDPVLEEGDVNHFAEVESALGDNAYWVTTSVENLELTLKWCDFWYSQVGSDLSEWGLEGVTFMYNDENMRTLTDFCDEIFVSGTNRDLRSLYALNCVGTVTLQKNSTDSEFVLECQEIRSVNTDSAYTLPDINLNSQEAERHSALYSDIATYVNESLPKFFTGEKPMDEWDSFIDTLYTMGLEECIEIYQTAYDRYIARSVE